MSGIEEELKQYVRLIPFSSLDEKIAYIKGSPQKTENKAR